MTSIHWWDWRLNRLDAGARGEPAPSPPWPANLESIDEKNDWFHEHDRHRSAKDVTSAFSQSFDRLKETVSRNSDDHLVDPTRFSFLGGNSLAATIAGRSLFEHVHDQHAREIEVWQEQTRHA